MQATPQPENNWILVHIPFNIFKYQWKGKLNLAEIKDSIALELKKDKVYKAVGNVLRTSRQMIDPEREKRYNAIQGRGDINRERAQRKAGKRYEQDRAHEENLARARAEQAEYTERLKQKRLGEYEKAQAEADR